MKKNIMIFCGIVCILAFAGWTIKYAIDFAERVEVEQKKQISEIEKEIKKQAEELKQRVEKRKEKEKKKKKVIQSKKKKKINPPEIIIPDNGIIYLVKKGDSINLIASKHLVLPYQVRKWNDLELGCIIHPGQKLKIKEVKWPTYIGKASWYGKEFHGRKMANTEIYNMHEILIAHRHLPLNIYARVTNLENGKFIICQVKDRGPYAKNENGEYDREVDLSYAAAVALGIEIKGVEIVKIEILV